MYILAAAFIDAINVRSVPGPSTHIDLRGIQFSAPAPEPFPTTFFPHLVVILHAPKTHSGSGVLEVVFKRDGEQIARNVQPLMVEPGLFSYRLVQAEIDLDEPCTFEAHVRIGPDGEAIVVPFSILDPIEDEETEPAAAAAGTEAGETGETDSSHDSAAGKESFNQPSTAQQ